MRRGWAVVLAVGAVLALTGCGLPAGTDGDLTNGWPAFPKAVTPVPVVGTCYPTEYNETWYTDFSNAVPCSGAHQTETVHVGTFTGADAGRSSPPLGGSLSRRTAYDKLLDQRTGRASGLQVSVVMQISLVERATGKVLFFRPSFEMKQRYEFSIAPQAYFDESETAVDRLSRDVARDVVSAILESF